jgi:hypothetical protein
VPFSVTAASDPDPLGGGLFLREILDWTLVRDKNEHPRSVLVINTDITDKKKIEGQLLRAQRMESIGTLAGGIAHDIIDVQL